MSAAAFGENVISKNRRFTFIGQFIKNLGDPIIRILIGALIINTIFMFHDINWPETVGIAAAVFIATLVSTVSEYGSEKAFDKLNSNTEKSTYCVVRNGIKKYLSDTEIVCGDLIYIGAGEMIPADCLIIDGTVTVNQSALTGESKEVKKRMHKKISGIFTVCDDIRLSPEKEYGIFKGCLCTDGECKAVVCNVGNGTFMGNVAAELQKKTRPSPLKEKLSALASTVSKLGYTFAALIMCAYLFNAFVISSNFSGELILEKLCDFQFLAHTLINAITLGVSVIVVAVPEGLPMMITVVLSSNMKKMLKSGVLVRKPVGIETAGSMNILFTDKTGTLTTGNMTLNELVSRSKKYIRVSEIERDPYFSKYLLPLTEGLIATGKRTSTEKAVISFFKTKSKINGRAVLKDKLSFNSKNKFSACLYAENTKDKVYLLGAAEKILEGCSYYIDENGISRPMTSADKKFFLDYISEKANSSARVMLLAEAASENWGDICKGEPLNELCAVFAMAIKDDLRRDIKKSVYEAKMAGVHVIMITGDNKATAVAIAKEAGIFDREHNMAISGDEMSKMTDGELSEILMKLAVVSRALPSDKLRLVELSGKLGLVSGMTGDGINDAPSLKNADVGFAMGSGSEVAKEAADIILTNNSFRSITNAILYGRCVFESIRKFITFQLTMNLCAMGVSLIGPFIGINNPITVIQMLWVNIIMDTLGGLAFAGEIPLSKYMRRPPINKTEKILSKKMINQILFLGIYTLALSISFLKLDLFKNMLCGKDETYFLTCFFALFIFCGIFNSFNARAPEGNLLSHIAGNKAFISIITFVGIAQLTMIYFGGSVFRTVPLTLHDLTICALLSLTVIPADMIRKTFIK